MNSRDKYEQDREEFEARKKESLINRMEAIDIINRLSLFCRDEFVLQDVEKVKMWILSR